mmetsp:Transcript_9702/g.23508  ORF Transcript_9702/g.23508 Transcript_9702/m.23508 type:complete len:221 (+) Transcript_9702:2407-3069(+)
MRSAKISAPDCRNPAIRGKNHYRAEVGLEGAVQEGKTIHVQHVNLVDEQHPRNERGSAFRFPLVDLRVDLISNGFRYFSRITRKQGHESLLPRVDDVNLVKCYGVSDCGSFLKLPLGALDELGIGTHCIVISRPGNGSTELGYFPRSLVDSNHVSCCDAFLCQAFDHFCPKIVNSFHVGCAESQTTSFSNLSTTSSKCIYLDFDNFSLHNFLLFDNAHPH